MPETWQRLHVADNGDVPPLLFKYSTTSSSYELHLTDLNYIWSENLDRKAILKRADQDDTTIDPSEDLDQFKVLLMTIAEGLQNEPGSKTSLTPKKHGSPQALELTVISKLPAPLKPLKWRFVLSKEPQSSTTSHLLLPLINAEADRESHQQSLIDELNKKDWVLGKLFDKIEAMGTDLSTVFPGASGLRGGRKGTTLQQPAKYIKGLAPFDEQSWREETSKSSNAGLSANIVAEISGHGLLRSPPDAWWESLATTDKKSSSTSEDSHKERAPSKPSADRMDVDTDAGTETGDDDEFERQETPPRLKKPTNSAQKSSSAENHDDEETASEHELPTRNRQKERSSVQEQSHEARPQAPAKGPSRGLGTIGGKKESKRKSPSPPPAPTPEKNKPSSASPGDHLQHENFADKTTDDDLEEHTDSDKEPPKLPQKTNDKDTTKPAAKPSRGMGVIGGTKKKEPTPASEPEAAPEPKPISQSKSPEPQSEAPKKKKPLRKLGVIGGQKTKAKPQEPKPSQSKSASPPPPKTTQKPKQSPKMEEDEETGDDEPHIKPPASPPPKERTAVKRETPVEPKHEEAEHERADRKRDELKRQLEAKNKAPAKKKRRF